MTFNDVLSKKLLFIYDKHDDKPAERDKKVKHHFSYYFFEFFFTYFLFPKKKKVVKNDKNKRIKPEKRFA